MRTIEVNDGGYRVITNLRLEAEPSLGGLLISVIDPFRN